MAKAANRKNGYRNMMFRIMPSMWLFIYAFFNFDVISGQFPNHLDLQKVDVIMLNNQKYNVLKPTVHLVTDYFEQFIQKRHNTNFPTDRIFIDENGFRHYWKGMSIPNSKISRKTEDYTENNNTNKETNFVANNKTNIVNDAKADGKREIIHSENTDAETRSTTDRLTPKRKKKRLTNNNFKPVLRQGVMGGSVVKTSFFCPFIGVITMTLNADDL